MAAKEKQIFFCKECGYESAKWQGQCPGCRAWNTFVEEKVKVGVKGAVKQPKDAVSPMGILQVTTAEESRVQTGMRELDRVLGGGIVKGSLVLVGGDPGIGKSTILLQMCRNLVHQNVNVLYVSGRNRCRRSRCVQNGLAYLRRICFFCVTMTWIILSG